MEKQISNKIVKYLNDNHFDTTFVYKRLGSANNAGMPDITGCHNGIRVEIEVKNPYLDKGSVEANLSIASKKQQYYIKKFQQLGCYAGVATSIDQTLKILKINLANEK
ncbi:MAG: hypothetical protein HQK65_02265 [Desulfamplus sp.]|nr:hypothetical protein [Desulfamplus sp.]